MRAIELQEPGLQGLVEVERPRPVPGPGDVLLRMLAASLNYRDLIMIRGQVPGRQLPRVPLSDGCGEVVAVGENVKRLAIGDRVATQFVPRWISGPPRGALRSEVPGTAFDGCLQDYMVIDAEAVTRAPAHMTDAEVATLPCAAVTAWRSVVVDGGITAGDRIAVQGTGGVSIFALQIGHMLGAEVIATSSSDEKLARARDLGAAHLINYRSTPGWGARVLELTDGRGVDLVVDVGGAGTLPQSIHALADGGRVAVVGVLGGMGDAALPVGETMLKNAHIFGVTVGSRDDTEAMFRAFELNRLQPVVGATFSFTDVKKALELMSAGGHFGKIVLEIDS
jgi:NADPH:quinone reductase-like Zn-dependent oxidoreductase